jgi:acetyl-CoA carboxylase biotin carboxyl carrier protein
VSHDIDSDLVRKLAELMDETGLTEIEVAEGDWHLRIAKSAPAPVLMTPPVTAPAPVARTADDAPRATAPADLPGAVKSPMVGTAYLAPDPQSRPFVSEGERVAEGQTLLIVEAMKVMNPIPAPRSGTITSIVIESGQPVEYGQVLLVIE